MTKPQAAVAAWSRDHRRRLGAGSLSLSALPSSSSSSSSPPAHVGSHWHSRTRALAHALARQPSSVLVSGHGIALTLDDQAVHQARRQNVLAKTLLLQQLQCTERRARVAAAASAVSVHGWTGGRAGGAEQEHHVLEESGILGLLEVLQVGQVGDKVGPVERLLLGEKVEVDGIGKALHKLGAC